MANLAKLEASSVQLSVGLSSIAVGCCVVLAVVVVLLAVVAAVVAVLLV